MPPDHEVANTAFTLTQGLWAVAAAGIGTFVGIIATKLWERARPLCAIESFSLSLNTSAVPRIQIDIEALFDKSYYISPIPDRPITLSQLHDICEVCESINARHVIEKSEFETLLQLTPSNEAERVEYVKRFLSCRVAIDTAQMALLRDETPAPESTAGHDSTIIEVRESPEQGGCFEIQFGGQLRRVGANLKSQPWRKAKLDSLIRLIYTADVNALKVFLGNIQTLLVSQQELHREFLFAASPIIRSNQFVVTQLSVANRGQLPVVLLPNATLNVKTKAGATYSFDCNVAEPVKVNSGYLQTKPIAGQVFVGGVSARGFVMISKYVIGELEQQEQILTEIKAGSAMASATLERRGIFGRTARIVSKQAPLTIHGSISDS